MGVIFYVACALLQCCSTSSYAATLKSTGGGRTSFCSFSLNAAKCERLRTKPCMIVIVCERYEVTNWGGDYVIRASYPPPKVDMLWQTRRMRLMTMIDVGMFSTFVVPAKVGIPVSPRDWLYLHNYVSVSVVFMFNRMIVWREISDR